MILQSLVAYYEALERQGKITSPGWSRAKVSYALELSEEGGLKRVIPLKVQEQSGKKTVQLPASMVVPQMETRSSGVKANFLCDNSSYMLGIDEKGKPERSRECFAAAVKRHHEILDSVENKAARAVLQFFDSWEPEHAREHSALKEDLADIMANANLIFEVNGAYVQEDAAVKEAWQKACNSGEGGKQGICLVTGQRTEIARIHGLIKGVDGAQSSGAALVSFNAPAFESYGKEQSYNAPVGTYAAYAYTTALNYLLSDREHKTTLGDTTIVYWAEDGDEAYQEAFSWVANPTLDNQEIVHGVFQNLKKGRAVVGADVEQALNPEQRFYILGLSPNAARIAVRFFYEDSFGNILKNLEAHYERMKIVRPAMDQMEYLGIWRTLQETVNKKSRDKKPLPNLPGTFYRSVLSGSRYPAVLLDAVLQRIRAEQDDKESGIYKVTRGRAAIIKAYLLKNFNVKEDEIGMALNEESTNVAYTLGREFAVLEAIQKEANRELNTTIKDRYFNSACATPALIFPILFKLKNSHIKKMDNPKKEIYFEKLLTELQGKLSVGETQKTACPKRLSLEEQGMFILGYYHQTQKRYEGKIKEEQNNG